MSRAKSPPRVSRAIVELLALGYTEQAIADALKADGIEVSQSTIHRIKTGEIEDPRFQVGSAILDLRKQAPRRPGSHG